MTRWERTLDGEVQIVLISGEAGIGKSRLMQRFHEQIAGRSYNWVEAAAGPFFQNTPFYPVAEIVSQLQAQHGNEADRVNVTTLRQRNQRRTRTKSEDRMVILQMGASTRTAQQRGKLAPSRELDLEQELEFTPQLADECRRFPTLKNFA